MKQKSKRLLLAVLGIAVLLSGCGSNSRAKAVKSIQQLEKSYQEAQDTIPENRKKDYQTLGESIQALLDITDKDSGELETEEEITQAEELVEEFYTQLNELTTPIQEAEGGEESDEAEFAVTFRNDSSTDFASLSLKDPQSGIETELDSFEAGKRIDTTVKVNVEDLSFTWYVYDDKGQCVAENTSSFVDAKEGIIIYNTEDGVYTESY